MEERERLRLLIKERALRVSDQPIFKLSSGRLSRFYIDLKQVTFEPQSLFLLGGVLYEAIRGLKPEGAGGLTLGADPLAYAVSLVSYLKGEPIKPFVVRKEPKMHGTGRQVEGLLKQEDRVVVLEDVMTTGTSALKAVEACKREGYKVLCVYAVVDREEGGRENLQREGVEVHSLFKVSELL
ncbi:MAG: orotate phosphoribosyltransferase [Aquificaceae bacterium]|nr:orotate phosphoribosyltransferase [Aquificaceae bacterium]MCS7195876.1 orotate phosphoribosyltransferase [Aquificaceae bacterium]MCX7989125.1 orotate phosphoribosyltransferase [Aquificaceae bacterium]MDW8032335.1 orotate phosphoribosyltransferase [Aquificaceae bacterium]MDW8294065.1 orotate phosphoribosyltransferase [Aquificaceae bacterium]